MPEGNPQGYLTPPFAPPQGDPYGGLTQLLQELASKTYTPPQESKLQIVLNAIAQGASIAASNDPGQALGNILQGRQQKQQQQEQIKMQQQNNIMAAQIQGALEKARGLQAEQAQARQEGRANIQADIASKRRIEEVKQIDLNKLDLQAQEFKQNQLLLSLFEPDINRRAKFQAGLQALPQQMQESLKMQTLMQTLVPDMPDVVAKSIADKQVGLTPRNFNSVENEWYSKFNKLRNEEYLEDKDLARRVKESEITENEAQATYYQNSKIQDRYANALQTNLGNAVADAVDTNYFRLKDGRVITQKQLQGMNEIQQMTLQPQPLSAEENLKEQQKAVQNLTNYRNQVSQPNTTVMPGQPTITPQDPVLAEIQKAAQTQTKEQILNNILNSTMAPELKQKYVRLVTEQYESIKGQMSPASPKKQVNALPPGVNIKDFMKK